MGEAIPIQAFSLEDVPQLAADFFTPSIVPRLLPKINQISKPCIYSLRTKILRQI
jgi:hypothetical protein